MRGEDRGFRINPGYGLTLFESHEHQIRFARICNRKCPSMSLGGSKIGKTQREPKFSGLPSLQTLACAAGACPVGSTADMPL